MPRLWQPSSVVEYLDVVHLHVEQALSAVKNDRNRAEKLRLITAPLKAWMSGECFDVERYSASAPLTCSSSNCQMQTPPAALFYSAVKRIGRTLHTVCSPILFCPVARAKALKLRQLEQVAEEGYRRLAKLEVSQQENDYAKKAARVSVDSPRYFMQDSRRSRLVIPLLKLVRNRLISVVKF